jgi:K+-sensing histidine kinase KdpD
MQGLMQKKQSINTNSRTLDKHSEDLHRRILTSVSHDLKTPLACIIGSLEIFEHTRNKLSQDKEDTLIHTALLEAYRLDTFITNILDMARLEDSAVPVKKELCALDVVLEDCRSRMGRPSHHHEIVITGTPTPFWVRTDPLLLTRAVCILLDNAIKYSPPHSTINIDYEKKDGLVMLRILDNGNGIPETHHEDIFSKYSRFALNDHSHSGTGLGLPICREVMQLLGGTVTMTNRVEPRGSIFTLTFPE